MCALISLIMAGPVFSQSGKIILDFEAEEEEKVWEAVRGGPVTRSDSHATSGKYSLMVRCGAYLTSWRLPSDWSGYDSLDFDAYNDTGEVVAVSLLVGDKAWQEKEGGTYWNRHNGGFNLLPGENRVSIPVTGLYRGEAGSRNNDIPRNIDPGSIVRVDLGFRGPKGAVYLDAFRLAKGDMPESVLAFDFGPESQTLWPGFTPVSWNTLYDRGRGFGFSERQGGPGAARDDTFPTRLFSDWTAAENGSFRVNVVNGRYRVWLVFSDCGYWGREYSRYTKRVIAAEGREVVREDRKERGGDWEPLYLFEDTEPLPGSDIASLYYDRLFAPRNFTVEVKDGQLDISFSADEPWSSRVAALVIHPVDDAAAEKWVRKIEAENRKEFLVRAAEVPLPAPSDAEPLYASRKEKRYLLFVPDPEKEVHFNYVPSPEELGRSVKLEAARGEAASFTFAVRPRRDLGSMTVRVLKLRGPAGEIPRESVKVRVVRNLAKRGFNAIRWRLCPWYLADFRRVDMPADLTRQFWVTVQVPRDAEAGEYSGELSLKTARGVDQRIGYSLKVLPFELDEVDLPVCFYGMRKEWLGFMREYGMTTVSGGPAIGFEGFGPDGEPKMGFGAVDDYMKALRTAGYEKLVISYQGPATLKGIGYTNVREQFARWGEPAGLSAMEAAKKVFGAIERHAKERNWLPYVFPMCDEPRVRDVSERINDSLRFLKEASPWLNLAGSYSVDFGEKDDPLLIQEMFRLLDVSILNAHDRAVMEQARKLNKDIYIYNQGRSRFIFGAYLFSERSRGIKGFCQWHMFATHGYQYFDLDGREPDAGIIVVRTDGIYPTVDLERVRMGVNDYRYFLTLERLARSAEDGGRDSSAARVFLNRMTDGIGLNQRRKPDWLDLAQARRQAASEIVRLLPGTN